MAAPINCSPVHREQDLLGQTVLVIGGSSGIGLETARLARAKGADIILTARNPDRLHHVGLELESQHRRLRRYRLRPARAVLPRAARAHRPPAGHRPRSLTTCRWPSSTSTRHAATSTPISCCRCRSPGHAATKVRPPGTLLFMSGTGGRRTAAGLSLIAALTAALPALTKTLALEIAPVRVNLIAPASSIRRSRPRCTATGSASAASSSGRTLPIGRVVGPADIAALAVHLMTDTAVTGVTFDIDGGQQLVEG